MKGKGEKEGRRKGRQARKEEERTKEIRIDRRERKLRD